jgi:hypothetical protein
MQSRLSSHPQTSLLKIHSPSTLGHNSQTLIQNRDTSHFIIKTHPSPQHSLSIALMGCGNTMVMELSFMMSHSCMINPPSTSLPRQLNMNSFINILDIQDNKQGVSYTCTSTMYHPYMVIHSINVYHAYTQRVDIDPTIQNHQKQYH